MPHTENNLSEKATRVSQSVGDNDRRAVGADKARTGLIIENDTASGSDLLVGFGPDEVTSDSYSLRLPPGARLQELGPQTPNVEVRIAYAGAAGTAHVTTFSHSSLSES